MKILNLHWVKCENDLWCDFLNLDLDHEHFKDLKGVYIIWSNNKVIRLGSGVIKDRIKDHRGNPNILTHSNLMVTWAKVNSNQMEGVEKYLADTCQPVIGERFPDREPIEVNLPEVIEDECLDDWLTDF